MTKDREILENGVRHLNELLQISGFGRTLEVRLNDAEDMIQMVNLLPDGSPGWYVMSFQQKDARQNFGYVAWQIMASANKGFKPQRPKPEPPKPLIYTGKCGHESAPFTVTGTAREVWYALQGLSRCHKANDNPWVRSVRNAAGGSDEVTKKLTFELSLQRKCGDITQGSIHAKIAANVGYADMRARRIAANKRYVWAMATGKPSVACAALREFRRLGDAMYSHERGRKIRIQEIKRKAHVA